MLKNANVNLSPSLGPSPGGQGCGWQHSGLGLLQWQLGERGPLPPVINPDRTGLPSPSCEDGVLGRQRWSSRPSCAGLVSYTSLEGKHRAWPPSCSHSMADTKKSKHGYSPVRDKEVGLQLCPVCACSTVQARGTPSPECPEP